MIKAVVAGVAGRMGSRLSSIILDTEGIELVGAFEVPGHPKIGHDIGEVIGKGVLGKEVEERLEDILRETDITIDFTHPDASIRHLKVSVDHEKAIVIGTTGFTEEQLEQIRSLGPKTRSLLAPNMSVGVNVLFKVVQDVARILGKDYDVEILETHHRTKKDAPSGTAIKLALLLAEAHGRDLEKVGVYARKGMIGQRAEEEIGIQVLRAGDIVGEHTVLFGGIGERIEITHRAHSRDNFARGAIRAAKWLVSQPKGLYDMQDVLGLK